MDLKQLPSATANPQFPVSDLKLFGVFSFRVQRQNRRFATSDIPVEQAEPNAFHKAFEDVVYDRCSDEIRQTLIAAYIRSDRQNQGTVAFAGSNACVTQRRYIDRWDKGVLSRIGKRYKRCLRVKTVFVVKGSVSQWVQEKAAK